MDNEDAGGPSTDNDNHHVWAGLEWEPGAKIRGVIKGGYVNRRYDEVGSDEDLFGMRGDLTYSPGTSTDIRLEAVREIIQTDVTLEDDVFGTHYVHSGGSLSVTYKFPFWSRGFHQFSATVKGFYYNDEFRERGTVGKKRRDDRYGGGVELDYRFWDRLGLTVKYRYSENGSNFQAQEYKENLVSFQQYYCSHQNPLQFQVQPPRILRCFSRSSLYIENRYPHNI